VRCDLDHDHSVDHCDKHIEVLDKTERKKCNHEHSDHDHKHDHTHKHDHGDHSDHTHSGTCDHSHGRHERSSPEQLLGHSHGHFDLDNHDHSHSHEGKFKIIIENVNIKAAIIHIIGDIVQSVGVVIASLIIYFNENLTWVDPLCTFIFSIIVIMTTYNITKQCILILMEATNQSTEIVRDRLLAKFAFLKSIHNLHIWELSSGKKCITFHAVSSTHDGLSQVTLHLKKDYQDVTVQLESEDDYVLCNNK
jgi:zinc transporter 2